MKNINTTGTFQQYVESIAAEIRRLLTIPIDGYVGNYTVIINETDWSSEQDNSMPALMVLFCGNSNGEGTSFSIAELEFERDKHNPEWLNRLIEVRFEDSIWVLEQARDQFNIMIEKLRY